MICTYCGKENPDNLEICGFCGAPLTAPSEEAASVPYTSEPQVTIIQSSPEVEMPYPEPTPVPAPEPQVKNRNRVWWLVGCFVVVLIFLCCAVGSLILYRSINGLASFIHASVFPTLAPIEIVQIPTETKPTETKPTDFLPTVPVPTIPIPTISIPTVTASPTSNQGLLFFDDFSDPGSGWDKIDVADYYTDYFEGSYRIVVYSDMSDSWSNPDSNLYTDVRIEVDTTKNAGPDDNDFGVICRYQGVDQFYYGVISSDGYYGITKVTSDSSTHLGGGEMRPSNYINQGAATNHIRFDCRGDVLALYVNGQQLDQQTDSDYTSGNVGLIAGTYDTPGTDILFDNFSVSQP